MAVFEPRVPAPVPAEAVTPITPEMIAPLRRVWPWTLFLGLYGLAGVGVGAFSATYAWAESSALTGTIHWVTVMVTLLWAIPLLGFSDSLRRLRQGAGSGPLESAMAGQLAVWRLLGIVLLVQLTLTCLAVSIPFAGWIASGPKWGTDNRSQGSQENQPPPRFESIDQACDAPSPELICGTVAFFDRSGKLAAWTGWHTFTPAQGRLLLYSEGHGWIKVTFDGLGDDEWEISLRPPPGRALMRGAYTGVASTDETLNPKEDQAMLGVKTPPAQLGETTGEEDDEAAERAEALEWTGRCPAWNSDRTTPILRQARFTLQEIRWNGSRGVRRVAADFEKSCTSTEGTWVVLGRFRASRPA